MKKPSLARRILLAFFITLLFVPQVSAEDETTCPTAKFTTEGITHYCSTSFSTCSTTSSGSLVGNNNEERAFNFFLAKGLSAEQASGIIGNLMVESGMAPDNQENKQPWPEGGWGIAQWTGSRRTDLKGAVKQAGLPYTNEATPADQIVPLLLFELNYLWKEADSRGNIKDLKGDTSGKSGLDAVQAAVISWEKHFEIAGNPALGARYDDAVAAYNKYKGNSSSVPADAAGAVDTNGSCGQVTDGSFVYYSQYDPAYAKTPYGDPKYGKTVRSSGCGPTSMAMIVSTLGKQKRTPSDIATEFSYEYVPGDGSSHDLFPAVAKKYGLTAKSIGRDETAAKQALASGGLLVAGGQGSAPYTSSGHVIVVRATVDGKYQVGNPLPAPADQGKSSADVLKNTAWFNIEYSWATIANQASGIYAIGGGQKS